MLDKLGDTLKTTMKKIANAIFIDKSLLEGVIKDLQRALLEADVEVELVHQLSEKIRQTALADKPTLEKKELLIKLIHDELVTIIGKEKHELKIDKKPFKIIFLGLYGCGKTTTIAKLAFYYAKRGFKTAVLGLDVHRPAAPEQLEQLALKAKVPCFVDKEEKNPLKIWKKFEKQIEKYDIVLIDTAGRDALSKELIAELKLLSKHINSQETVLVMPGDIGQTAKKQASEFKKTCSINGVIITRLDGTAKGGGALTACVEVSAPVLFIGVGENIEDIEVFNPTSFVARLLGMGDLETLLEKAKSAIEKETQSKLQTRLDEGKFTLVDLYEQLKAMSSMGPLNKIIELVPGLGKLKIPSELLNVQEAKLKHWKTAIDSMTPAERENPDLLNSPRISRISKGSIVPASEIRELLKQYKLVKSFFVGKGGMQLDQKKLQQLAKRFGGRLPF